jgi:hypothetical protein
MENLIQFDEAEYLQIDFTDKSLQLIASLNGDEVANNLYAPAVRINVECLRNAV